MSKSKKTLLFFVLLLVLLIILCIITKSRIIYDELYPKSSIVSISKQNSKVLINGTFSKNELAKETISKLKMFNKQVEEGEIVINNNIKNDKWQDIMDNISYYFSNNLENAHLLYKNNKLELKGTTLSKNAKNDLTNILEKLKTQGIGISDNFNLIEAKTSKQKVKKEIYDLLYSKTIEFEKGKAVIKDETFPLLNNIIIMLKEFPDLNILIQGHTDDTGEENFNQKLSLDRANAIKKYFVDNEIAKESLFTIGYGETRPAFPNNSEENRQKNRRVEFKVKGE